MRKLILLTVALFSSFVWGGDLAEDNTYLFWRIDTSEESGIEFYGARLYATMDEGETLTQIGFNYNKEKALTTTLDMSNAAKGAEWSQCATDGGHCMIAGLATGTYNFANGSASFYIELFNLSGETVGYFRRGGLITMDELIAMNAIEGMVSDWQTDAPPHHVCPNWTATEFSTVPEPTGGVLSLLGVALLALRRRREV